MFGLLTGYCYRKLFRTKQSSFLQDLYIQGPRVITSRSDHKVVQDNVMNKLAHFPVFGNRDLKAKQQQGIKTVPALS